MRVEQQADSDDRDEHGDDVSPSPPGHGYLAACGWTVFYWLATRVFCSASREARWTASR